MFLSFLTSQSAREHQLLLEKDLARATEERNQFRAHFDDLKTRCTHMQTLIDKSNRVMELQQVLMWWIDCVCDGLE